MPATSARDPLRGFTLVELLVIISIIGVLVSLLLPAVNAARESARRTQCMNHMRNLGMAVHGHLAATNQFPPASQFRIGGQFDAQHPPEPARHSMITFLLPYFEQGNVYDRFNINFDWNDSKYSNNNITARQDLGGILICPSAPGGREDKHVSDYNAANRVDPTGPIGQLLRDGTVRNRASGTRSPDFGNWRPEWDGIMQRDAVNHSRNCQVRCRDRRTVQLAHVKDGLSNTLMLFESAGKPICYINGKYDQACTESGSITRFRWASSTLYMRIDDVCAGARMLNCANNSQPYSFHKEGANFTFGDGSGRFINEGIHADVFISLFTLAAGEVVSLD